MEGSYSCTWSFNVAATSAKRSEGFPFPTVTNETSSTCPSFFLAKGDDRQLYNMKHNGITLLQKGPKYFGGEAYQELMMLVDKHNHLRMVLSGKTESMVRTMKQDLAQ